jgi:hypothetical protein
MEIFVDNETRESSDIRLIDKNIKHVVVSLLRKEFKFKINDIAAIFGISNVTIHNWLSKKADIGDDRFIEKLPYSNKKPYLGITIHDFGYRIKYFTNQYITPNERSIRTDLISGDSIHSIVNTTDHKFSKSRIGRIRKSVFNPDLIKEYNNKLIIHINKYLSYHKPIVLISIKEKTFAWHEESIKNVINNLYKDGFGVKSISHILKSSHVVTKFDTTELKQTVQLEFAGYIWLNLDKKQRDVLIYAINQQLDEIEKYTPYNLDLTAIFNEVFQTNNLSEYNDEAIKKQLYASIDNGTLKQKLSKIINEQLLKDTNFSRLYDNLSIETKNNSILNIFVKIAKFLHNHYKFTLRYDTNNEGTELKTLTEYQIKTFIDAFNKNIYYSTIDKSFRFKNIHDVKRMLKSNYLIGKE